MNKIKYIVVFLVVIILGVVFLTYHSVKNEKYSAVNPSTVSTLSIINDTSTASAILAGAKDVSWQTTNYPEDAGVNINLIKKTSDLPRQFVLVRVLATNTQNDGKETWVPQNGENSNDLYVEVVCSSAYQFSAGCNLLTDPIKVN
jgi:hypothetical protein